ncbi:tRNA-splicing ligase RtcB [Candidatus Gugararchaeum adminiculabundum]|nr:tRNA-splicing ligase RtcB [Candidatus Gugararchaeum adminiculabundum]
MVKQIGEAIWEFEKQGKMRVPARVYATKKLFEVMQKDRTMGQLKNVASLPGIVSHASVMSDGHEGYGFPIGGVAAFDENEGVVSPGGVGYDINCGVRLIRTELSLAEVKEKIKQLVNELFTAVPSGVGAKGRLRIDARELDKAISEGAGWAVKKGYGWSEDLEHTEENGGIAGADPAAVTDKAKKRGMPQFGTLGAGNHFLEMQEISEVADEKLAAKIGLQKGNVAVMLHCGSRGFGHQICDDNVREMYDAAINKYKIDLPERELCCVPLHTPEADRYLKAMNCAVNYAFTNRQVMTHWVREAFDKVFGKGTSESMKVIYDVCHNIAKYEEHEVEGQRKRVLVHRKGATRALPAGRSEIPKAYRDVGQPVLIPGSMGTASYVLIGAQGSLKETFGSTCHGAGRIMSRAAAIRSWKGADIQKELADKGIYVKATEYELISEEAPGAYKDVDEVVKSVELAGLSKILARMKPIGTAKG